jgi:predicted 3-demethylubiquinone-9 3-methyltransferase (glyoxalase superfamily)
MIALFACQKDDLTINDTYYKIYDTELSGKIASFPTSDLGVIILEAENNFIAGAGGLSISFPNIIKLDQRGNLVWKLQTKDFYDPTFIRENPTSYSLYAYSNRGQRNIFQYITKDTIAEIQIDKEKGTILRASLRLKDRFAFIPQNALDNNRFLYFDNNAIHLLSENFSIMNKKTWNVSNGNIEYIDKNNQHILFNHASLDGQNSLLLAVNQDLSSVTTVCFSSLNTSLETKEIGIIVNAYPINEEEYIFIVYSNKGLQTSFYFTPAISIQSELANPALKDSYFQNINAFWTDDENDKSLEAIKAKYGNQFRLPLRSTDILEKARKSGEVYRTFNLDINDKETFIRKAKDRILIIKNSGGYEILLYEYLVKEKKYKLLKTLGRNIPYYLQDAEVNDNGDLFMIGNTQVAKDLNSLFVIKLPYEDIPR